MTTLVSTQQREVSTLGFVGLALAVVAFPVYKVQFIDRVVGENFFAWSVLYVGAEAVIGLILLASVGAEHRPLADVGIVAPRSRAWWIVLGAALCVAGAIIALRHLDVLTITGRPGQDYGALVARHTWQRVEIVISSAVVVPIEELIWRGFAITRLQRLGLPTWVAVLVPSAAFGYFHGGTLETVWISVFITGSVVGLSVIFLRTRSLVWPMLIHFAWIAVLVSLTPAPV